MKLSAKTISILKNFSTINPSIVLKPGTIISTISPTKTIMARATVPDVIPVQIAIYNLSRFISSWSLFNDPEMEFSDTSVRMSDTNRSIKYHYSDSSIIMVPPDKEIKLPSVDAQCRLSNKDIQNVIKALGVLALPEVAIVGDGKKIMLQACNSKEPSSDAFSIDVGVTDRAFRAIFKPENLKMVDSDYEVTISSKGISEFVGSEAIYWIAVETTSTF
jgi:hypothetical protein